jgi:hypothetical protein
MTILDLTRDNPRLLCRGRGDQRLPRATTTTPAYADSRHDCWTTGLVFLMVICIPQMVLAYLLRSPLALITIRDGSPEGSLLVALTILNLLVSVFFNYCASYLRVEKRSVLFVCLTIPDLIRSRLAQHSSSCAPCGWGSWAFFTADSSLRRSERRLITLLFAGGASASARAVPAVLRLRLALCHQRARLAGNAPGEPVLPPLVRQ